MQRQSLQTDQKKKVVLITALFATSVLIMLSGAFFIIYSIITHTGFMVLNAHIHGAIFGALVFYLGLRYFLSVKKLKTEVYKTSSKFSWGNFKRDKTRRLTAKSR